MASQQTTDGAYIVVAQTNEGILEHISKQLDPHRRNHVVLTSDPKDVLLEVLHHPVDMVVTGEKFYDTDKYNLGDMLNIFGELKKGNLGPLMEYHKQSQQRPSWSKSGTDLAELLYRLNPGVLLMRYSIMPGQQGRFVADIKKLFGDDDAIFALLNSPQLAQHLREGSVERLHEAFPAIRFYDDALRDRLMAREGRVDTASALDHYFGQYAIPVIVAHRQRPTGDSQSISIQFVNICGYGRNMFSQGLRSSLEAGVTETEGVNTADLARVYDFGLKTNWSSPLTVATLHDMYAELRPAKMKELAGVIPQQLPQLPAP